MEKNRTDALNWRVLKPLYFKESVLFLVNISLEKTIVLDFQRFRIVDGARLVQLENVIHNLGCFFLVFNKNGFVYIHRRSNTFMAEHF